MISRQPSCAACGCEWHLTACSEACPCDTSPVVGVYLDPWQPSDYGWLD